MLNYNDLLGYTQKKLIIAVNSSKKYEKLCNDFIKCEKDLMENNNKINDIIKSRERFPSLYEIKESVELYKKFEISMTIFENYQHSDEYDNFTGADSRSLYGEFLEDMTSINKYVFTTSSTNFPFDINFNPMFIGFYTLKNIALKVKEKLISDENISMISGKEMSEETIYKRIGNVEIIEEGVHEYPKNMSQFTHLFNDEKDPLVYMEIEDTMKQRRNLYKKVLDSLLNK